MSGQVRDIPGERGEPWGTRWGNTAGSVVKQVLQAVHTDTMRGHPVTRSDTLLQDQSPPYRASHLVTGSVTLLQGQKVITPLKTLTHITHKQSKGEDGFKKEATFSLLSLIRFVFGQFLIIIILVTLYTFLCAKEINNYISVQITIVLLR